MFSFSKANRDIEEIVAHIRTSIRLKLFKDKSVVRVSCTFRDGKFVFSLETFRPSAATTEQDIAHLRKHFGEQFGNNRVDFDYLRLVCDHEIVDAVNINTGSAIHTNQGCGTGTVGLVVKWRTSEFVDDAAVQWGWKESSGADALNGRLKKTSTDGNKNTDKFAIITAEHVVRQYSKVAACKTYFLYFGTTTDIAVIADTRILKDQNSRALPPDFIPKLSTYYCPKKCHDVHYDIVLCTVLSAASINPERVNYIPKGTVFKGYDGDRTLEGRVDRIDIDTRHGYKQNKQKYSFYLMGQYSRTYGVLLGWGDHKGVFYLKCSMEARKGDSGGLLFEVVSHRNYRDCCIRAVGIMSKLVTVFRDESGMACCRADSDAINTTVEAWFTPLNYLNIDSFELISELPSSVTTPSYTTNDSTSDLGSV